MGAVTQQSYTWEGSARRSILGCKETNFQVEIMMY